MKRHTLNANRGETFSRSIRYLNPDRTPIDLSSHTATFTLRDKSTGAVTHTYPASTDANGFVIIKVADEVTATWPNLSGYVLAIELAGDVTWLLAGTLNAGDLY